MRIPEYSETLDSNGTHTPEKCRRADDANNTLANIVISNDPVRIDENWYVRYKRLAISLWVIAQLSISNPLDPASSPKSSHTPADDEDQDFKTNVTWSKSRIDESLSCP